jgi:hypothetical protein
MKSHKELSFILWIIFFLLCAHVGTIILKNHHEVWQEHCDSKFGLNNYSIRQSFNDSECGCYWFNLCDRGCLICERNAEFSGVPP